jgi:hypothetical protein
MPPSTLFTATLPPSAIRYGEHLVDIIYRELQGLVCRRVRRLGGGSFADIEG